MIPKKIKIITPQKKEQHISRKLKKQQINTDKILDWEKQLIEYNNNKKVYIEKRIL